MQFCGWLPLFGRSLRTVVKNVESPLSVFAIGVERLAMGLFKYDDIGDVNGFLRKRCFPEIKLEDGGDACAEG